MKILRIIARLNVGGPARHVVWLTKRLNSDEFQSSLIAGTVPDGEEDMSYFAVENGVVPHYIEELSRELSPKDTVSLYKIYREIVRQKPDVIHTHTAKAGTVGRLAAFIYKWLTPGTLVGRPRNVKVVHTFHGHVFHSYYSPAKTRIFLMIEKVLARLATDRIVVITQQQLDEIHGVFRVGQAGQFAVIPLGIDLSKFADREQKRNILRREIGALTDDIVVGFTGRLTEIKNVSLLIQAAKAYKASGDVLTMKFAIVGDGGLRSALEKEAGEAGLKDTVFFLGNREDVPELLAGMDIIALTSKNEGTPLSLIEAMSAGTPFVSTSVGGVADLAGETIDDHGGFRVCERGVLVDTPDAQHFADGLLYLAKDEKLRERLGRDGIEFTNQKYSVDRLSKDIASLYRDLVEVKEAVSDIA